MKLETLIKNGARLLGMTYNYVNYQEWVSDVSLWNRDFNLTARNSPTSKVAGCKGC